MKRISLTAFLVISSVIFAQKKDKHLYEGTQDFSNKKYINAEANFRISQSKNEEKNAVANYNLGNSIYRQNLPGEAKFKFSDAVENAKTKQEKHKAYHNLGNTFMLEENYQAAVDAYKNALRNNPLDEETRYNYALAKQKLKENPPKGNQDNKDKNQNQDQKQDNQDDKKDKKDNGKDKDKKDSDQGDKNDNKNKGNKKEDKNQDNKDDKQSQNPKPSGANKQQIESILDAVNNAEKNIQDKINAKKIKAQPKTNDKDW